MREIVAAYAVVASDIAHYRHLSDGSLWKLAEAGRPLQWAKVDAEWPDAVVKEPPVSTYIEDEPYCTHCQARVIITNVQPDVWVQVGACRTCGLTGWMYGRSFNRLDAERARNGVTR